MRHHNKIKKLSRTRKVRRALLRTLAVSFLRDRKIKTTETKAKTLRPFVERLITRARRDGTATRRLLYTRLGNVPSVERLCKTIAPNYKTRSGGYTRIIKAGIRRSDGARMAIIQLVD